jgi:hypothetical protein
VGKWLQVSLYIWFEEWQWFRLFYVNYKTEIWKCWLEKKIKRKVKDLTPYIKLCDGIDRFEHMKNKDLLKFIAILFILF